MKKILLLSYGEFFPFKGGIANYTESIIQSLKGKAEITVLTHFDKSQTEYPDSPVSVLRPRFTRFDFIKTFLGTRFTNRIFQKLEPDAVIITHPEALKLAAHILGTKTPVYYVVYGTEIQDIAEDQGVISKQSFIESLSKIQTIIAISIFTKNLLLQHFPQTKNSNVELLYPTVTSNFVEAKPEKPQITDPYFLSIGRLVQRKGHETIIRMLPEILKTNPDLKYVIIGNGPEKNNLQQIIHELQLKDKVILTGEISEEEKKGFIQHCSFYIHPSISKQELHQRVEGFGIAIVEALSQQKPCIIYNNGGMTEIIVNKQNGYIIEEANTLEMIRAITEITKNPSLFAHNAVETYETKFHPTVFAQNLLKILQL